MKLSWSHKLFFLVNKHVGKNATHDRIMLFFAMYGIFIYGVILSAGLLYFLFTHGWTIVFLFPIAQALTVGLALSWAIGWLFPHPRPIVEFPKVKQLLIPLSNWKAFPSDHTIVAFILAEILWYLPRVDTASIISPSLYSACATLAIAAAFLIAGSRVYVGVHYPRDIVGGIIIATLVMWFFFYFLPFFV